MTINEQEIHFKQMKMSSARTEVSSGLKGFTTQVHKIWIWYGVQKIY